MYHILPPRNMQHAGKSLKICSNIQIIQQEIEGHLICFHSACVTLKENK